jgi:hypothetical protein
VQNITDFESEEQVAVQTVSDSTSKSDLEEGERSKPIDYNMYQTFWELQLVNFEFHHTLQ